MILLIAGVLLLLIWIFIPPYARYVQKKKEYRELKNEIEALKKKKEELELQLMRMETDPVIVEEIARKKLGMLRPGEVVYVPVSNSYDVNKN